MGWDDEKGERITVSCSQANPEEEMPSFECTMKFQDMRGKRIGVECEVG